ncbi:MAG: phenylalanine--tRNA ligase beta subunit-related protein [Pseudomonadota bacterium]
MTTSLSPLAPRELVIDPGAFAVLPALQVHGVVIRGYADAAARVSLAPLLTQIEAMMADAPAMAADVPLIAAWREAYRAMGLKPSKYRCSIEALWRRARKDPRDWLTGLAGVDVYNALSLLHTVPAGVQDLAKLPVRDGDEKGIGVPYVLRGLDPERDTFMPLGQNTYRLSAQLLGFTLGHEVVCWALNHRDSQRFCLQEDTADAIIFSEGTTHEQSEASQRMLEALADLLTEQGAQCGAIITANQDNPRQRLVA